MLTNVRKKNVLVGFAGPNDEGNFGAKPAKSFLLFLISPLIPIVLVVKDSLLNSDIEETNNRIRKHSFEGEILTPRLFKYLAMSEKT